jgi:hypothetical protein
VNELSELDLVWLEQAGSVLVDTSVCLGCPALEASGMIRARRNRTL